MLKVKNKLEGVNLQARGPGFLARFSFLQLKLHVVQSVEISRQTPFALF